MVDTIVVFFAGCIWGGKRVEKGGRGLSIPAGDTRDQPAALRSEHRDQLIRVFVLYRDDEWLPLWCY